MNNKIKIYILDVEHANQYIAVIRKFSKENIYDIKEKITLRKPIVICEYTKNPDELIKSYQMICALFDKGAEIKILQNIQNKFIREIDKSVVSNLIERRKEINQEVADVIDLEIGEQ